MINRSNIDLLANATSGVNLGTGDCIFKCKNVTGNTLEFKTISVAGGLSIITGDTTLTISGGSGGGIISGATNYIPKYNSLGNGLINSSILDSGNTNIWIQKNNVYIGGNTGSSKVTIQPSFHAIAELIAYSGVNIGSLNDCLCVGHTTEGLTVCSAAYCDLLVHAGSYVTAGQAGKHLLLSGGDGQGNVGGDVIITGSTGTVSGNIILSTPTGRIKMCNLPTSTQTNTLYIDGSGNLSKGLPFSGTSYWIKTGTNLSPAIAGDDILLPVNDVLKWSDTSNITSAGNAINLSALFAIRMCAGSYYFQLDCANYSVLGAKTLYINGLTSTFIDTNTGSKLACLHASNNWCVNLCGGNSLTASAAGTIKLLGGNSTCTGAGGDVCIKAGSSSGGAAGKICLVNLPARVSETNVVYVDNNGKLSCGSANTGGTSTTITGATSLGSGYAVYASTTNCGLRFKSLLVGSGIAISCTANDITICGIGWSNLTNGSTVIGCGTTASGSTFLCNTFIGVNAGKNTNIAGIGNTGIGFEALKTNTNGTYNIAVGYQALINNTSGSNNIAMGQQSLNDNTTGSYNIAEGFYALCKNTTGVGNIAFGVQTLRENLTGSNNIAMGTSMLYNTIGSANVGIGVNALYCNTTADYNIAIGYAAMQGPAAPITGGNNVAIGQGALLNDTSGAWNIAVGYYSMRKNTTGIHNTALGYQALYNNIVGSCNVAIGYNAGSGETNSNRLHIANCSTKSLIYGEFDNNYLKICGCLEASCAIKPASATDASMPNNSIYFSTTAGKLVYKDAGGTVNQLY